VALDGSKLISAAIARRGKIVVMPRKKLIFFCSADPRCDTGAFFRAYHFATVASKAGLESEVRLAGMAVDVTDLDVLPNDDAGDDIRTKVSDTIDGPVMVSL